MHFLPTMTSDQQEFFDSLNIEGAAMYSIECGAITLTRLGRENFVMGARWAALEILRRARLETEKRPGHLPYVHLDLLKNITTDE